MSREPTRIPAEPRSGSRLRVWLRLLAASRAIEDRLRRRFRQEFGTTLPRFDVMSALARRPGGLKMSEISSQLRVSNGNVTGIVDRLTEEGVAVRVAVAGDRRASLVRLTPKGVAAFEAQAAAHEAWVGEMLTGLDEEAAGVFIERLDRLLETLRERTTP